MNPPGSNRREVITRILSSRRCMEILNSVSQTEHTIKSLAKGLNISLPSLRYHLKILNNAHVIDVRPSFEDMRSKILSLSENGKAILDVYENWMKFHPLALE